MTALAITSQPVAREYLRVSKDASGRLVSTAQQSRDHAETASDQGWSLGIPYAEADAVSASRYSRKTREGFAALCADLESGAFGADILIMWEASRGSRRAWEWLRLIESLRAAGVAVHITSEARTYDMRNARDRKSLRDSASDSEYESDKISGRVGRAMKAEAEAGNPHGKVIYGYAREYRLDDGGEVPPGWYRLDSAGKIGRQYPHPAEAPAVRLIFRSLLAGESLRNISAALAGEGPQRTMGATLREAAAAYQGSPAPGIWAPSRVRDIALNPAYAGKRLTVPGGNLAGARADYALSDLRPGNWPALVNFSDWLTVRGKLTDPARLSSVHHGAGPRYLLSMIATCGVCGGPLAVRLTHRAGVARYNCTRGGHVTAAGAELDALVTAAVLQRLSASDVYPRMTAAAGDSPALQAARDALAALQARAAEITAAMSDPGAPLAPLTAAARAVADQIRTAERAVRDAEAPDSLSSLGLAPGADIWARWQAAPLTARRQAIRAMFASVRVMPAGRGNRTPVAERLQMDWR